MTDRELLENAAITAGMRVGFEPDGKERGRYDLYWSHVHHQLVWHGKSAGAEYPKPIFWNPLTDDGDALRLAVKLNITVQPGFTYTPTGKLINCRDHANRLAATRRAIVRAAAEIGKGMK